MKTLKKLLSLLAPNERKRAVLLMAMTLVMAVLDALGVASILPFMAVMSTPELLQTNVGLKIAYSASSLIGIRTVDQFLFFLGVLVFLLLVTSLTFKAITTYMQTRFALMREYSIGKRLVEGYLRQPYSWFLNRNSVDLTKIVLSEVQTVVNTGMLSFMMLMAHGTVALALMILLLLIDPLLAVSVGATLGMAYCIVYYFMSGWLKQLGTARAQANEARFSAVSESFGAVKELKVGALEQTYIQRFSKSANCYARVLATSRIIGQVPRYALEAIAFGGMLLVILYLMVKSGGFSGALPVIALYAFAGYRLMPALQNIYQAFTQLRFAGPATDLLSDELKSLKYVTPTEPKRPIRLSRAITLDRVTYQYPNAPYPALKGISLNIEAHSKVGFVGLTGSGKTTLLDVILALLSTDDGSLLVDGQPIIDANRREWQRAIGYVPQHIYLSDESIASNIAFGVPSENIDQSALEWAAEIANLHEFIKNELPEGYATKVGERGVRLSGGQCQRIGIARALYHRPQLLVLDEATSALDNSTEQAVMGALNNLGYDFTLIVIAHRHFTLRQCDRIYMLDHGEIKASGTFDELISGSQKFASLTIPR